jgi:hypothetical protein
MNPGATGKSCDDLGCADDHHSAGPRQPELNRLNVEFISLREQIDTAGHRDGRLSLLLSPLFLLYSVMTMLIILLMALVDVIVDRGNAAATVRLALFLPILTIMGLLNGSV